MTTARTARTTLLYWTLQIVCWFLFFYAQYTGDIGLAGAPANKAFTVWTLYCLAGIGLTEALRQATKRWAWFDLPPHALALRMAAGTLVILVASWVLLAWLSIHVYGTPVTPLEHTIYHKLPPRGQLVNQCIFLAINILIWVSLYWGIVSHRHNTAARLRQAQLAEALQAAELRLLKSQLNPHFLFNALNSVRALIAADPETAQDAVTRLARALRYTLAAGEEDCVTLARELEMVDDYLGAGSPAPGRSPDDREGHRARSSDGARAGDDASDPGGKRHQARHRRTEAGRHPATDRSARGR
jgi:hypothetical protein